MKLENMTKKELLEYIKAGTIEIKKYNTLEHKFNIRKQDGVRKEEQIEELKKSKIVFENTIRQMEASNAQLRKDLEAEANRLIAARTANVVNLENDLEYTKGLLTKNFEMLIHVRKHSDTQHQTINDILDTYTSGIATIEEK